jgi:L-lysine 2,3-aminomutase
MSDPFMFAEALINYLGRLVILLQTHINSWRYLTAEIKQTFSTSKGVRDASRRGDKNT